MTPKRLPVDESPKGTITPSTLVHLRTDQLKPSPHNPRRLFDPGPLSSLKASIREHGVLVPLTVFKLPGQARYAIVDGERRYKSCVDLEAEGINIPIPANVVDPPSGLASLIYMFNIHQFREQWELMPTARALRTVIEELGHENVAELNQITGLSEPQIERCLKILSFPERYQETSLAEDPKQRIPSNFWVELHAVLERASEVVPDLVKELGRNGITDRLVEKYRAKRIKSVIHFRRILEAFDVAEGPDDTREIARQFRDYVRTPSLETRAVFDRFIRDPRRVQQASEAADQFMKEIRRAKIDHTIQEEGKEELAAKLREVVVFVNSLLESLEGTDPPQGEEDSEDN